MSPTGQAVIWFLAVWGVVAPLLGYGLGREVERSQP